MHRAIRWSLPVALVILAMAVPAQAATRSYTLYATDGWVTMPDGNVMYVFGFNDTGIMGQVQLPAPMIWANVGDEVLINFVNLGFKHRTDLTDPHTVHLHGIHSVPYHDGFPELSFAIPMGESFTYKFTAHAEGTFMYHCHVEAVEHVQMGMYGPVVIYGGAQMKIYGRNYTKEYIWLLSEFDSRWHKAMEPGAAELDVPEILQTSPPIGYAEWLRINYRPDYWMVNGMAFPDTLRTAADLPLLTRDPNDPSFVAGIQNQIFVANGQPAHNGLQRAAFVEAVPDEPVLVRIINMGFQSHPFHLHGQHYEIIGEDARPLPHLQTIGRKGGVERYEKFTINIGSGETYDTIVNFDSMNLCMSQAHVPEPEASPFPDETGPLYDPAGPYFYAAHCHDDNHVTNQGVYPGGMVAPVMVQRPVCTAAAP
jgi:FtsP/CotA-like multicopper oxidase with cupredoxin domain